MIQNNRPPAQETVIKVLCVQAVGGVWVISVSFVSVFKPQRQVVFFFFKKKKKLDWIIFKKIHEIYH